MVNIRIVCWGAIGNVHGRCYKAMSDIEITAVADVEADRLKKGADFFKAAPYASAQGLIDKADVDIIDICLPTFLHAEYAIKAMEKGRDVISEKPMALDIKQCTDMIEAHRRTNKLLMIGHCVRFWPEYQYLKHVHSSKMYGELQLLGMIRTGAKTMKSWKNWMLDPVLSGSQTVDRHIHDVDFILYLLGIPSAVRTVGHFDDAGLSHVNTHYIYPNGPAVFAEGGGNIPPGYPFTMIYRAVFDAATIEFNRNLTPKLLVYPWKGKPFEPRYDMGYTAEASEELTGLNITSLAAYYNELRYFIDCVVNKRLPSIVTPHQAQETLLVALAEVESATTGYEVLVSSSGERIGKEDKTPYV